MTAGFKTLVTGGAGFIGSHLCDALLAAGHAVTVLDDLSTGRRDNVPKGARFVQGDIRSPAAAELVRGERPDAILHFAAQMDVRRSVADPSFDADVNIRGLINLCEAASVAGTRRLVFASTGGAIYGDQDVYPAPETHPTRPLSPYGVAKAAGELFLGYYKAGKGLSFSALRFANVYGPRQNPHGEAGVVAIFCGRILGGQRCTITGDGRQTRDFVYVEDVARAAVLALGSDFTGALNIGTGAETSVLDLHDRLCRHAGVTVKPSFAPARPGEQRRSAIDPSRALKVLDWRPAVGLDAGLARTFDWFRTT